MRRTILAGLGGVGAALLGSLCCVGPLLFVTFGVGAGLASTFEPLRPLFTLLAVLALGFAFYSLYGRKRSATECAPGEACAVPRDETRSKIILWAATVLAFLFWSFTYWSTFLI